MMKTRSQILLAVAMVVLSLVSVLVLSRAGDGGSEGSDPMEGHDHSAMSAGADEAKPVSLSADESRRIGVTYATVTRGTLPRTVRTVGIVTQDETRLTAWRGSS
jgi:hypothetical protein